MGSRKWCDHSRVRLSLRQGTETSVLELVELKLSIRHPDVKMDWNLDT